MAARFLIVVVAVLSGCATPATQVGMTASAPQMASSLTIPDELKGQIAIKDVVGGGETNPMLASNISSSDFEAALEASLRNVGLGAPNRQSGKFLLSSTLVNIAKPFVGVDLTVTTTIHYDLIRRSSNKTAWAKTISSAYTAKFSESFLATERLRLANEGSARTNIETFIKELLESGPR